MFILAEEPLWVKASTPGYRFGRLLNEREQFESSSLHFYMQPTGFGCVSLKIVISCIGMYMFLLR